MIETPLSIRPSDNNNLDSKRFLKTNHKFNSKNRFNKKYRKKKKAENNGLIETYVLKKKHKDFELKLNGFKLVMRNIEIMTPQVLTKKLEDFIYRNTENNHDGLIILISIQKKFESRKSKFYSNNRLHAYLNQLIEVIDFN